MKLFLSVNLFLLTIVCFGQDTIYCDSAMKSIEAKDLAVYYKVLTHDKADTNRVSLKVYSIKGQLQYEEEFGNYTNNVLDGKLIRYYDDGTIAHNLKYRNGRLDGRIFTYWEGGKMKRNDLYINGNLVEGKCFTEEGQDTSYFYFEKMPEFPGGEDELMKYLVKNIKYPNKARRKEITGRVIVHFIVNTDGSISDVKIIKSVYDKLDEESMRVVKAMPKWSPGVQEGRLVRVSFNLPVVFTLKD